MRSGRYFWPAVIGITTAMAASEQIGIAGENATTRPAQCAGSWYPGDRENLAKQVDELLHDSSGPSTAAKPVAVISPHAGYRFSAPVAAHGYRYLRGHEYRRVIVLALSHQYASRYDGVEVPQALTGYETPLGIVPIDRKACDLLLANREFLSKPEAERGEHSLELQLPFLQRTLGEFQLVPLLVGRMTPESYTAAAKAIAPLVNDDTLLVASSDFTHFGPRFGYQPFHENIPAKLRELADKAAKPLLLADFDGFTAHLDETGDTVCGRNAILLLLRILSLGGGAEGVKAAFDTSGQMTGDWSNSVSYYSIVFTRRPGTLGNNERKALLRLARQTVTSYLTNKTTPDVIPEDLPAVVQRDGACFVTLQNHGRLRGCIGNMEATGPLVDAVVHNAVSACQDRRFITDPVTATELDELDIEISYLTPMKPVDDPNDIIVGRHGLLITLGYNRGVLLPQVAYERGWSREEFLEHTCRKAGLPPDAWKDARARIECFEAEVFGEH